VEVATGTIEIFSVKVHDRRDRVTTDMGETVSVISFVLDSLGTHRRNGGMRTSSK